MALPTLTGVSPSSRFVGETVVISGTGFTTLESVSFGQIVAQTFQVLSDTQATVQVPVVVGETVVTATNPDGTSIPTSGATFICMTAADTIKLWGFLPPFAQENDAQTSYQFLRWLDGSGQQQQILDNLLRDGPSGQAGWSIILDVARCPTYALPWLGQFVGVRFTPAQLESDSAMRAAIVAPGNFARGTVAALNAAIAPYLLPNGYITVIERFNGTTADPYAIYINVTNLNGALTYGQLAAQYPWLTSSGGTPDVTDTFPAYNDFPTSTYNETLATAVLQSALPGGLKLYTAFS